MIKKIRKFLGSVRWYFWYLFKENETGPSISILTCIYAKTPYSFFSLLAQNLKMQRYENFEWVLLVQGEMPPRFESFIKKICRNEKIKLLRSDKNLGIIAGLRKCFENASSDYVAVVDGDDLLTRNALIQLGKFISKNPDADLVFTDEDQIKGKNIFSAFRRPGWDPILNLSCSYIWHLLVFKRETGASLGVYTDTKSEWCQDWDTITRFSRSGKLIKHLPEVLYHWRQHENSSTNTATPEKDSLLSQQNVLNAYLQHLGLSSQFDVEQFPIFRGATEYWLRGNDSKTADVTLLEVSTDVEKPVSHESFHKTFKASSDIVDLRSAVLNLSTEFVLVWNKGVIADTDFFISEAKGLMHLHPEVCVVGGPLVDVDGKIVAGDEVYSESKMVFCPNSESSWKNPGPYAIYLKPRSSDFFQPYFFFARSAFLKEALREIPIGMRYEGLGLYVGGLCMRKNKRIAHSPLMRARLIGKKIELRPNWKDIELAKNMIGSREPSAWKNFYSAFGVHI